MTTNVLNCSYDLDTRVKVKRLSNYAVLNVSADICDDKRNS